MSSEVTPIKKLLVIAEAEALERGGVDNWDFYSDALEEYGYEYSSDDYTNSYDLLNALRNNGVDNWEWYDASRTGLDEYEEYLEGLEDIDSAVSFFLWQETVKETPAKVEPTVEVVEEPTLQVPSRDSDKKIVAFIEESFPEADSLELFDKVMTARLYAANTFPKEFKKSLEIFQKGVEDPFEKARVVMLDLVIANGKLKTFIKNIIKN